MKVFADATETSFFKTDEHVKNLHSVEINSIEEFVFKYSLNAMILMGGKSWMVTRFDELKVGNPTINHSTDEPELHGECLDIDFIENINLLDILVEIQKYIAIDDEFLNELKESRVFTEMKSKWIDDNKEEWLVTAWNDSRVLQIVIENDDVTTKIQGC